MGSDEIVDWREIDPIFCWVESILLVQCTSSILCIFVGSDLACVANSHTGSYVDFCSLRRFSPE